MATLTGPSATFADAPFGTYYLRMRARNANGVGSASPEKTVSVAPPVELLPTRYDYIVEIGRSEDASDALVSTGPFTKPDPIVRRFSTSLPPGQYVVRVRRVHTFSSACEPSNPSIEVPFTIVG